MTDDELKAYFYRVPEYVGDGGDAESSTCGPLDHLMQGKSQSRSRRDSKRVSFGSASVMDYGETSDAGSVRRSSHGAQDIDEDAPEGSQSIDFTEENTERLASSAGPPQDSGTNYDPVRGSWR